MDKRKIVMFLIILLIVVIVLVLLALINLNEKDYNNDYNDDFLNSNWLNNNLTINNSIQNNIVEDTPSNEISQDDYYILEVTDSYSNVTIDSVYFAIEDKANDFFKTINTLNRNNTDTDKLYNILAKEYINKKGITKQNLKDTFSKYINSKFNVEKITEKIEENNICVYVVYGSINEKEKYNMAIVTDETNLNYCIYPYEYLKENGVNSFNVSSIARNSYNEIVYKDLTKEELAQYHFNDYIYYAQNNPEKLYNKLDLEYSKKRFGSLESFKEYINENEYRIETSSLKSYKFTREDDYVQYSCIDNYGNRYLFKETDIMQYTVILDNYTIMSQEDIAYYNELNKLDKAKYNLTKFINMVNTKDYNGIYNVLDNTFKNNNFKDITTLKQYIQKNMYTLNSIELEDIDDNYGYYIFDCTITNVQNDKEKKDVTIIINLEEGTEFTMSLNLQ